MRQPVAASCWKASSTRRKPRWKGPFGDHTGYYCCSLPVAIQRCMHLRQSTAIYQGSYMGRAPFDEPSVMAMALNDVFVPLLRKVFTRDRGLLPAAGSVFVPHRGGLHSQSSIRARRIMMGIWSYLRQFTYTKFVIVTDDDIDVRDWSQVIWAISTRVDPVRDSVLIDKTPIDYLDFSSPTPNLGSKLGLDATNKWPAETTRTWSKPIQLDAAVEKRVDAMGRPVRGANQRER